MSKVVVIDPAQNPDLDKFVESHPFGWICHLSHWKRMIERNFPQIRGYYLSLINPQNNQIQAVLPVYLVKSCLTGTRLVSIPFATLCDPLISITEEKDELLAAAIDLAQRTGASHLELRTFQSSALVQGEKLGCNTHFKNHYLALDKNPEDLIKSFHRTCCRQRISRAQKSILTFRVGSREEDMARFYRLHVKTRKRNFLPPQPYPLFRDLWNFFGGSGKITLLLAEKDDISIAGLILFKFRGRVSAEFAASDEAYKSISPNHFLFWEAIKSAYREGYKVFDFGRTASWNESLMNFKRRWGTKIVDLPIFYYPKEIADTNGKAVQLAKYQFLRKVYARSPEPILLLIGRICYRHLGG